MAITIPIITDFNSRGIDSALKQFKKLETNGQKAAFAVRKAAIPAGIALVALGAAAVDFAKAAIEDAAASDLLAGQLKRVTGATDAGVAAADKYITALSMQVGIADDQLRPALGKLATATGDVSKAQDLLGIALDVSAQTGKPLEAVTTALGKAYGGNLGALKKLIPGFDEGIIKSKDFEKAQAELAKLTGGAAADAAETGAGKFRTLGVTIDETKEAIGAALLPAISLLLPVLQSMATFVQENATVVAIAGVAIAAFAAAIIAVNIAMKVAAATTAILTAAQYAYNLALSLNPIGIVILALAAFVAAVIVAYNTSDTFRGFVDGLGNAFKAAFNWISENVGPIISAVVGALKTAFDWIKKNADPALNVLKTAFVVAFAPIYAAFKTLQALLKLLGSFDKGNRTPFNPADPGSGLNPAGGFDGDPATPFAMGGIVTRPTLGLIGEAGPEAVIPLDRLSSMGGITINVQAGLVSTPDQIGQQIIEAIQNAQRRSGPVFAAA